MLYQRVHKAGLLHFIVYFKNEKVFIYKYLHVRVRHHSTRNRVRESGDKYGRQNRRFYPDVVIRVNADILLLGVEGKLAEGLGLELVM